MIRVWGRTSVFQEQTIDVKWNMLVFVKMGFYLSRSQTLALFITIIPCHGQITCEWLKLYSGHWTIRGSFFFSFCFCFLLHLSPTKHPRYQNHVTALKNERDFNKLEKAGAQRRLDLLQCQKNPSTSTYTNTTCTAEGMKRNSQLRRIIQIVFAPDKTASGQSI